MSVLWLPDDVTGPDYSSNPKISVADPDFNGQNVIETNVREASLSLTDPAFDAMFTSPSSARTSFTVVMPVSINQPVDAHFTFIAYLYSMRGTFGTPSTNATHYFLLYRSYREITSGDGIFIPGLMFRYYFINDAGASSTGFGYSDNCLGDDVAKIQASRNGKNYIAFRYNGGTNVCTVHLNNAESKNTMSGTEQSGEYTYNAGSIMRVGGYSSSTNCYCDKIGAPFFANGALSDAELDEVFDYYKSLYGDDVIVK